MLGVDIDGDIVNVVEVKETSGGVVLFGYATAKLPHDMKSDTVAVGTLLERMIATRGLAGSEAVTCIEGTDTFTKQVSFPHMPDADLRNAVWWEAERTSPFPLQEAEFAYHLIKEVTFSDGSRKVDVLVAAAKKERLQERVKVLDAAGLAPVGVVVRALALLAALKNDIPKDAVTATVLIDIGRSFTTFVVCEEGHPTFIREMRIGDADFTESICAEIGVSPEAAELLKRRHGIALKEEEQRLLAIAVHEELEQISDALDIWGDLRSALGEEVEKEKSEAKQVAVAVRYPVERLVGEIERSLGFWRHNNPSKEVGQIFLTGVGALLKDIDRLLSARLGAPVTIANPLAQLRSGSPTVKKEEIEAIGTAFTVAYGLALQESRKHINLMPARKAPTRPGRLHITQVGALFVAAAISLFVALLTVRLSYSAQISAVEEECKVLAPKSRMGPALVQHLKRAKASLSVARKAWDAVPDWREAMRKISGVPQQGTLWFRAISFDAASDQNGNPTHYKFRIEGYSYNAQAVTSLAVALSRLPEMSDIRTESLLPVTLGDEVFSRDLFLFVVTGKLRLKDWQRFRNLNAER